MAFVDKKWLADWVQIPDDLSTEQLAADLVKVGLEEEQIHSSGVTGPIVKGVCLSREEFTASNGKTIGYCRVDVGEFNDSENDPDKELSIGSRGIICGATNLTAGDEVVVALPGAVLPGDFEIAARKTYGHISNGMIRSERELGLGNDHDGIIRLQNSKYAADCAKLALGEDLLPVLGLNKELLEINITPDRGYCFSYRGVAREFALSTGAPYTDHVLSYTREAKKLITIDSSGEAVQITDSAPISGQNGCTNFVLASVSGVAPNAKTPSWMATRLENSGMRSISLPVDITNYVMLHFGQPLHAYDADETVLPIVVRRANKDEKLQTLDEKLHNLDTEDLLICDSQGGSGKRAIGIAGVMGGYTTEVTEKTQNILLESACFSPVSVSRSARRHKIPSEASRRFERGIDPQMQAAAACFAAELLVEFGGGKLDYIKLIESSDIEQYQDRVIDFSANSARLLLGFDVVSANSVLTDSKIKSILELIGCEVDNASDSWKVTVPSWRPDLSIQEDLTEEIARVFGYDEIPNTLPSAVRKTTKALDKTEYAMKNREKVANFVANRGYVEVLTYPFTVSGSVKIANPLAGDKPYLRETLLQTLLDAASLNIKRNNENVNIFEIGRVFKSKGINEDIPALLGGSLPSPKDIGQIAKLMPSQPIHISLVRATDNSAASWAKILDDARNILWTLGIRDLPNNKVEIEYMPFGSDSKMLDFTKKAFHPFMSADIMVNGKIVGRAGRLHPNIITDYQLATNAVALEMSFDALTAFIPGSPQIATRVTTFPPASEDYAIVVNKDIQAKTLKKAIINGVKQVSNNIHVEVKLFDYFESEKLGDKKSLSFNVVLRADHTFKDDEIKHIRESILKSVEVSGGKLRQ